jgi:hypothetical protein
MNQFWQIWENVDKRSLTCVGLYFYLVKVWNACGRPNIFRRQNTLVCAELSMSKPTLMNTRNWLKQVGLVDFHSKGKGDENISYEIINIGAEVKKIYFKPEVKKENNFTSHFTSPFTSADDINSSSIKDLFVVVDGEVKNFYYLKNLFDQDEGLRRRWLDNGYKHDDFLKGMEYFFQRQHGKSYEEFTKLRDHVFNWIPKYQYELNDKKTTVNGKHGKANGQGNAHKPVITGTAKGAGSL